jgi:hypothetical protein
MTSQQEPENKNDPNILQLFLLVNEVYVPMCL